ncbi:hypothetical protein ABVN80_21325 [Acinetobacter baumannii]
MHRQLQRIEKGLQKVLSKNGYLDSSFLPWWSLFEAVGLSSEVVDQCFLRCS